MTHRHLTVTSIYTQTDDKEKIYMKCVSIQWLQWVLPPDLSTIAHIVSVI